MEQNIDPRFVINVNAPEEYKKALQLEDLMVEIRTFSMGQDIVFLVTGGDAHTGAVANGILLENKWKIYKG